jgi:hypothetical protein
MIRKKSHLIAAILALALMAASCHKYSYYYRDKETKTRDCSKPATTSHKYKSHNYK